MRTAIILLILLGLSATAYAGMTFTGMIWNKQVVAATDALLLETGGTNFLLLETGAGNNLLLES